MVVDEGSLCRCCAANPVARGEEAIFGFPLGLGRDRLAAWTLAAATLAAIRGVKTLGEVIRISRGDNCRMTSGQTVSYAPCSFDTLPAHVS
jgi:hypothetical protein